jgi:hypothetical protein
VAAGKRGPSTLRPQDFALISVGAGLFLIALGALTGVALASFVFGGGWVWPHGVLGATRELGALLRGHPARGLDQTEAQRVPGAVAVWVAVLFIEAVVVVVGVVVCRRATETVRPSDARSGLATRADAAGTLGRRRLTRQRAAEIRPDLYGKPQEQEQ